MSVPDVHVPELLRGCWQRAWIEFTDGRRDDTSIVIWLQLDADMADVRLPGDRGVLGGRTGFDDCSTSELRMLADSESSSGVTRCSPVVVGSDGVRRATAEWATGADGIAFQPVSAFPEPGHLEWRGPDVMIERAPSGAYVEEWHRIANTADPLEHVVGEGRHLYRAGDAVVLVRDRPRRLPRTARLEDLVGECSDDRERLVALLDCEFSFARRRGESFVIEASTLPWREGDVIDVGLR